MQDSTKDGFYLKRDSLQALDLQTPIYDPLIYDIF